ncbi:homeobox protein Hox-A13a [Hoplias malabaricus]|uniref:homeobox protein Hox-A13a n=1 Tax=Hoplias malabaricus TaxID=27720 RepID=UPI003463509A
MTTSLLLRPRWIDPVMFLYDNGGEAAKNMDAFPGGDFAPGSCRNHPAYTYTYTSSEAAGTGAGGGTSTGAGTGAVEPGKQCSPCSASQGSGPASLPFGYFSGGGYYPCRMTHHHQHGGGAAVKPCAQSPAPYPEKYMDMSASSGDDYAASRAKEFAFYPSYASSPYQPVPGYLDVAVSGPSEHRHEPLLPVDSYQPWAISASGWNGQVYCTKEQPHSAHVWKSSLPEAVPHGAPEVSSFRRGRKKRVPYTKVQLKELEREYAANKFITKDKRRRISAQTNLSERQVTIWFQNRRVKEKKIVNKVKSTS